MNIVKPQIFATEDLVDKCPACNATGSRSLTDDNTTLLFQCGQCMRLFEFHVYTLPGLSKGVFFSPNKYASHDSNH